MFGRIGVPELVLFLAFALIIFGPRNLPEFGRSFGSGLREFRKATSEIQRSITPDEEEEKEKAKPSAEATSAAEQVVQAEEQKA